MKKKLHAFSANYQSAFIFCFALLLNVGVINGQTEIATNGDFETGDDTGWLLFQNGGSAVLDNTIANGGTWSGKLETGGPSNPAFKQEAIGVGAVAAGDLVTISFDHIGSVVQPGAVFNVLLFGEGAAGASFTHVFNPAPVLAATWTTFTGTFTIPLGTDVSGGVSFLIEAVCGGDVGCSVSANIDNVSVTVPVAAPSARVQVIHNSADAAASLVDVYLDGTLLIDDFAFRTASPFINAPAGTPISVAIAPSTSTSVADAIATFPYTLAVDETYVLVAEGIVSPSGYSPATAFDIAVYGLGREAAVTAGNTDVLVHHGSTDAPTVDVDEVTAGNLVNDISYGEFDGYLALPTADYQLQVKDATGTTVVASYDAPLATLNLDDAALVIVASGFLDPSVNSNGPAFGLWVALPSGGALLELPAGGTAITDPTVSALEKGSTGNDLYVYSGLPGSTVANFNFNAFQGAGTISEVDIESDGNNTGKIENLSFYGAQWDAEDLVAGGYTFVHLDYYATTSSEFNFYLIDATAGIPGGNAEEPRYRFGGATPDEAIVAGEWRSIFIPLSHFTSYPTPNFSYDLNDIFQWKFDGNGTVYFDNVYFSSTNVLGTNDFELNDFSVSPNPTRDNWIVKTNNQIINSVVVFDILGKQVLKLTPNSSEVIIDATELNNGVYLTKITTSNGSKTVKLIKQ